MFEIRSLTNKFIISTFKFVKLLQNEPQASDFPRVPVLGSSDSKCYAHLCLLLWKSKDKFIGKTGVGDPDPFTLHVVVVSLRPLKIKAQYLNHEHIQTPH